MKLIAAWHEWSSIALAVMIDSMLAVSTQCGCCHHIHTFLWLFYALSCIQSVWCYFVSFLTFFYFFFGLLHVLLYVFWFCHLCFTYDITWFDIWLFLFLLLHGVCVVGIMGYLLVGVLFFCLCTTTYVCISYDPYNMYPYTFFYFFPFIYILYSYFLVHIAPGFTFSHLCDF